MGDESVFIFPQQNTGFHFRFYKLKTFLLKHALSRCANVKNSKCAFLWGDDQAK